MSIDYLVTSSFGNDSIALIQHMINEKKKFAVVFNDTGWARPDWPARVAKATSWLFDKGITVHITRPEEYENRHAKALTPNYGFESLVAYFGGYPMPASKHQWCTMYLKEQPTLKLLDKIDPEGELTIVTGRRREESQNRADLPQWQDESPKHGGREVWNPLFKHSEDMRDILINQTPFNPLPHSSMECYPCVCANKSDFKFMLEDVEYSKDRIARIKQMELTLGHTRNGKPRAMFRAYRHGGGVGIESVLKWAESKRGWKADGIPEEYKIKGVDYSGYHGSMSVQERKDFWQGIKDQCVALGYDLKDLHGDIAYDDTTKIGVEFARQCDGGFCGS